MKFIQLRSAMCRKKGDDSGSYRNEISLGILAYCKVCFEGFEGLIRNCCAYFVTKESLNWESKVK